MRPETVFILSSLDVRTLAEFPKALDPCVNEALRTGAVINAMAADGYLVAGMGALAPGTLEPLTRADFGGSELVEDNLPESLTAWYTAACSGTYDIHLEKNTPTKIWGRYRVATCEMGPTGSHGGCSHCLMCKVRWEPITPVAPEPVPVPVAPVAPRVEVSADDLRKADVNIREAVAKAILNVTVAEAKEISTPTPIPGVVIPKPETGLPPLPITIPTTVLKIPEAEIKDANTIEFQELIPGIKPPAIPLLIPGLEKLPLLPGWTIRNPAGRVVSEGARIPTLPPGIIGIPIPKEMPGEELGPEEALATLGAEYPALEGEYYPEEAILEENGGVLEPAAPDERLGLMGETLELGNKDEIDEMVLSVELEEEELEL